MSKDINEKKKFKERLNETYRIVVIDNEDLKEVGNYQLSMARIYSYVISAIFLFSFLLISLIAFTPLKRLMPGYGDIEENSKFLELRKNIIVLEEELETQMTYTQGLQNMLSGSGAEINIPKSKAIIDHSEADDARERTNNVEKQDEEISLNNQYFVSPVLGVISARFDRSKEHLGVDILAPKNTAIKAISAGVVLFSDFTLDTGNSISIQHANNVISMYKHNSAVLKKAGDNVSAGEAIAIIGNTGELTDGPHLHFELWYNGNPVNPENFVNFK